MPNRHEGGPVAKKGDLIVVNAARVGGPPREGEVIEVVEGELRVQYRIRWNDGHESLFAPGAGAARIEPARDRKRTGRSQVTKTKKSLEKVITRKKPAEKNSAANATAAKRSSRKR
jgi:hypothetical protein